MKSYLDKLKNVYDIHFNGEYVVIPHTKLHILRPDGTLVACRSDLRYAARITFLSGNRLLVCSLKHVFHMIDLTTGQDLWTVPTAKTDLNGASMALSADEAFAYTYDTYKDDHLIIRLDLNTLETEAIDMHLDSGATMDICCDEEGIPCLLKTGLEIVGGKNYQVCGVRLHDFSFQEARHTNIWKTKWFYEGTDKNVKCFFGSTNRVLTTDFHIYDPGTGEAINLLENETERTLPKEYPGAVWLDHTGRYLCVRYARGSLIIDTQARKIAATYAAEFKEGCLVGSVYWLGTETGVVRKPFPLFEEIPAPSPVRMVGFADNYYAKHPKLW